MNLGLFIGAVALVLGDESLWKRAFEISSDPGVRDFANYEYFVAVTDDPRNIKAQLEEALPIPGHWLFSTPKGYKRQALSAAGPYVYDMEPRQLQKRLPVPLSENEELGLCESVERPYTLAGRDESIGEDSPLLKSVMAEFDIKDPYFKDQWHLFNHQVPGNDMNIIAAWRLNHTGAGVTVAVVDDGIDYTHPDLQSTFYKEGSWDYNDHENMPTPKLSDDGHGTRCAGEIAAARNDRCGVGIAPNARVAGIRILSGMLLPADEARALIHRNQENDIYSCSWGPSDNGSTMEGPPAIVKRAILHGVEDGRQGKGSVYVFASGNGFRYGDNCNYDGYTNSIYSITIAAIDINNAHPYYSESCSANMAVTYSSNSDVKITTTDRMINNGGNCTNKHTGTSAAAPIAAGVLALVLEARPELTWRDVQYVVREAARPFELVNGNEQYEWLQTHDGKLYHPDYGYGVLDAERVVEAAKTWTLVKPQAWFFSNKAEPYANITEQVFESTITVTDEDLKKANLARLEHVNVVFTLAPERRGAVSYALRSPSGFEVQLAAVRPHDESKERIVDWTFSSVAHWGENAVGDWTLKVQGEAEHPALFENWSLKLWGEAEDAAKAKRFSDYWNEFNEPVEVVQDAVDMTATTAAGEDFSSLSPSSTTAPESFPPVEVVSSIDVSPTSAQSTPQPMPTEGGGLPNPGLEEDPEEGNEEELPDDHEKGSAHRGFLFVAFAIIVGTVLIASVAVPIAIWYKRRMRPQAVIDDGDFALVPSDIEMDELYGGDDSFTLSDDDVSRTNSQRKDDARGRLLAGFRE